MTKDNSNIDSALEMADASKRSTLRKLVIGSAFVVPAVTSFALDGMTNAAYAANATLNSTSSGPTLA
jgi:hypothetical protein